MTYGAFVRRVLRDCDDADLARRQLRVLGARMGRRLCEEFLAASSTPTSNGGCRNLRETAQATRAALTMFLSVAVETGDWSEDSREFSVSVRDNPLSAFTALPDHLASPKGESCMGALLAAAIQGAYQAVHLETRVTQTTCSASGDKSDTFRVVFLRHSRENVPEESDSDEDN
ncbi:MAG: hypothetical protein MHM6MM_002779 [Cercozoa sp. M6MM]